MPADTGTEPETSTEPAGANGLAAQVRRQRTALLILGAVGVLLVGFAAGVLIKLPLDRNVEPDPGPVDIGFSQDMSAHHAQAVDMAGVALIGSTDNDVRRLAYDILTTQQGQIGRMQGWLQMWGKPNQNVDGHMGWMTEPSGGHEHSDSGGHTMSDPVTSDPVTSDPVTSDPVTSDPVQSMPGMASSDEMTALRQTTGPALDTMFLQLMLRHHEGGVLMTQYAAKHAATTAISTLAGTMEKTQKNEAELITTMLAARNTAPLPLN